MFGFQWHLTDLCNRRCRHCYQESHAHSTCELDAGGRLQVAGKIMHALADELVTVNLTGGEPMILPDLLDLMRYLESFSNLEKLNIITNGTIADRDLLRSISNLNRFNSFRISIESGDERINDSIRGAGALQILKQNIPVYKSVTGREITLMMTLCRLNASTIGQTIDFARESGADKVLFERFVPLGSGQGMSEAVLTADDWYRVVNDIVSAANLNIDADDLASCRAFGLVVNPDVNAEDCLEAALCNLGRESMALMPDGTVFPCRRLQIPSGNIARESFDSIRDRLAKWDCSNVRPVLRGVVCGNCPYDDCPGCRALALAVTGDAYADDPQCVLNRD